MYWFPAKKYGWGWGLPCSWQGWVVFTVYIIAMTGAPFLFIDGSSLSPMFYIFVGIVTVVFLSIVWLKGERIKS